MYIQSLTILLLSICTIIGLTNSQSISSCGPTGILDAPVPGVYEHHGRRHRRSAVKGQYRLWPNARIPYVMSNTISGAGQRLIRNAMLHWENGTCIRFVRRTTEQDYVYIYRGRSCCSHVGRRGSRQSLSLGTGCLRFGIIVHELGHTIGFWHEQSRPDRGSYIDIFYGNIANNKYNNFDHRNANEVETFDQIYDYKSIMHYGSKFFSKNGKDTMVPRFFSVDADVLGKYYYSYSGPVLSRPDILKTNLLYNCSRITECGGTLFDSNGTFSSSNYPDKYLRSTRKQDCIWVISSKQKKVNGKLTSKTLMFEHFDVGSRDLEKDQCPNDYVEIRGGRGYLSPFLSRNCGKIRPDPVTTMMESISVRFQMAINDDALIDSNHHGFKVRVKTDACSDRLTALRGVIRSPNYPKTYPSDTDCMWSIDVPDGYQIVINFRRFSLQRFDQSHGCVDYIDIREGDEFRSTFIGRYCSNVNPGMIRIASNRATIVFHSSNQLSRDSPLGFRAVYKAKDIDECSSTDHNCAHACINYPGGYACACLEGYRMFYFIGSKVGSCVDLDECGDGDNGGCSHKCINTEGGYVCACPKGMKLDQTLKSCLDIDECNDALHKCQHHCHNNLGGYTCSCRPGYILEQNNATCKELPRCGGHHSLLAGELLSPRLPFSYSAEIHCQWFIRVPRQYQLGVNVDLDWNKNPNCGSYLQITALDGNETEAMLKFCHKQDVPDGRIELNVNQLRIDFHTKLPSSLRQFKLRYHSRHAALKSCGHEINHTKGIIRSIGFPFSYESNSDCKWILRSSSNQSLIIEFNELDIEASENCEFDYLKIVELQDGQFASKLIGRFCGETKPPNINISPNAKVILIFKSDETVNHRGFELNFRQK